MRNNDTYPELGSPLHIGSCRFCKHKYVEPLTLGVYVKWSLNCSASSPEGTFWRWTLQCSHEPIASPYAEELIRGALEDDKNRPFIEGKCTPDKRTILLDVPSRYLAGYSVHCDLLDAYRTFQAEDNLYLLAFWLVYRVITICVYPSMYDERSWKRPGRHRQIFVRQLVISVVLILLSGIFPLVSLGLSSKAFFYTLLVATVVESQIPVIFLYL